MSSMKQELHLFHSQEYCQHLPQCTAHSRRYKYVGLVNENMKWMVISYHSISLKLFFHLFGICLCFQETMQLRDVLYLSTENASKVRILKV